MLIQAKVICDSVSPSGERLTTVEVEFHRFILPELNTHRVFSRNYQSSRAIPVQKMIDQVRENPAIPVHWGKNQAGMQADVESDAFVFWPWCEHIDDPEGGTAEQSWKYAARNAALMAQAMHDAGYHKQVVNRLLEPFMWTKGIITADQKGWDSFFALRCHPAAQPEIQALAYKIQGAMEESKPRELKYGQWHLPYVNWKEFSPETKELSVIYNEGQGIKRMITPLQNAIKISTSCTAQVSYRRLDDSLEKAEKIYDMLNLPEDGVYPEDPPHFSPAEHVAKCVGPEYSSVCVKSFSGNFNCESFLQYRQALEVGIEKELIND